MMHGVGTIYEASNLILNFNSETESSRGKCIPHSFHYNFLFFLMKSGPSGEVNSLGRERDFSLLSNQ